MPENIPLPPPPAEPGWRWRKTLWSLAAAAVLTLTVLGYQAAIRARERSQDSVVLCNVGQLAAAADQYFLENGKTSVALNHLVGPTAYLKALNVAHGEAYPTHFTQGVTITVTGVAGARTITYAP
jgi:type IV pilus assembly protein PilA